MRELFSRLWQDVRGNVEFWILSLLGVAAVTAAATLTRGLQLWQQIILVALFVALFVWASISTYRVQYPPTDKASTTVENVEFRVVEWVDAFGLTKQKLSDPSCYFAYKVIVQTNIPLFILRTKNRDHYLTLIANVTFTPEQKTLFQNLSEPEKTEFTRELRLEAAKAKIATSYDATSSTWTIERRIPITLKLTEAELLDNIGEINYSVLIIIDTLVTALEHRREVTQPSPTPSTAASPH